MTLNIRTLYATLISLIFVSTSFAQTIEKYFSYNWKETKPADARFYSLINKTDSGWYRSDYFMATKRLQMVGLFEDSNSKSQNGYVYYYSNGMIEQSGNCDHGKKIGLWLTYHTNGMIADSTVYANNNPSGTSLGWHDNDFMSDSSYWDDKGNGVKISWYDNGNISSAGYYSTWNQRIGKWQYFHKNGRISSFEIYEKGTMTSKECYDENGNILENCLPDTPAIFPGGQAAWQNYLVRQLYFPPGLEFRNADAATVLVSFAVDEDGNIKDAFVDIPLFPQFDAIALDVIKKSPKWKPAIQNNRKIKSFAKQPVVFLIKYY
jgi:hypothetical protein